MDDTYFMALALALAENGKGFTSPNPVVGAVVVKADQVVGRGFHAKAGAAHAEVNAIDDAGQEAFGATLYVTLEPCNHTGRTPPCTEKILASGIRRVVVAMEDPNPEVTGGGTKRLMDAGIPVTMGVLRAQAMKQNETFIKFVLTKKPFVTLKCAATLDGQLATRTGDSKWVTGEKARGRVHELRHLNDAILVGVNTIVLDDPQLTTRREGQKSKDPIRIVLDSRLSIPETAKVLRLDSESDTVIFSGGNAGNDSCYAEKKERLEKMGVKVMETPLLNGRVDVNRVVETLGILRISSLLVEGGGRMIASFLKAGVVDKVIMFFAPKLLCGNDGVPVCQGAGPEKMDQALALSDITVKRLGDDVMIEGYLGKRDVEYVHGNH